MLGVEYTGHTEKEFITHKQFMLNLKMYTAAFIELSGLNSALCKVILGWHKSVGSNKPFWVLKVHTETAVKS